MEFQPIETDDGFIKSEDALVEFGPADLPEPGRGFERFFEAITANEDVSVEQFDSAVLKTYGRGDR